MNGNKRSQRMSKEKEIQNELERYWSQLDRVERMLKFLCIRARVMDFKDIDDASAMPLHGKALVRLQKLLKASPDISDILEGK